MNEFKRLRLMSCKTISQAAKELNIGKTTISNWEQKNQCPSPNKFHEIAKVYGCSIEAIVNAYASQD